MFGTCVYLPIHFVGSTFVFFAVRQIMFYTFSHYLYFLTIAFGFFTLVVLPLTFDG